MHFMQVGVRKNNRSRKLPNNFLYFLHKINTSLFITAKAKQACRQQQTLNNLQSKKINGF